MSKTSELTSDQREALKSAIAAMQQCGWTHRIPELERMLVESRVAADHALREPGQQGTIFGGFGDAWAHTQKVLHGEDGNLPTSDRESLQTALHALRSYQYGNASPDLAQQVADRIELQLAAPVADVAPSLPRQVVGDEWRRGVREAFHLSNIVNSNRQGRTAEETCSYLIRTLADLANGGSDTLLQSASEDALYADNYRWLRQQQWDRAEVFVIAGSKSQVRLGTDCPSLDRLDAIIAAARARGTT